MVAGRAARRDGRRPALLPRAADRLRGGHRLELLADRLRRLVTYGLLWRTDDETHRQKIRYSLTEPGVQLVPVMAALGTWGRRHLPASHELSVRAELLEKGGPELWDRFMDELREQHLGIHRPPGTPSVFAELHAAYEAAVASSTPERT